MNGTIGFNYPERIDECYNLYSNAGNSIIRVDLIHPHHPQSMALTKLLTLTLSTGLRRFPGLRQRDHLFSPNHLTRPSQN